MNGPTTRHAWAPDAVATLAALGTLIVGLTLGTALAWGVITDDLVVMGRTIIAAGAIVGIAADLLYMARRARLLVRAYRRRP